jgi:hypothetical protein
MWDPVPVLDLNDWRILVLVVTIGILLLVALAFLASAFLLRVKNIRKAQHWARRERAWDPVLEEVVSGLRPAEELARLVTRGDELYFVDYLYRHAKSRGDEEVEILRGLARPGLHLIAERTRGADPERRARAVHTLSVLAFHDHVGDIVAALDDPSPLVAMTAARALAHTGGPRFTRHVLERLHRFEDWSPRFLTSMLSALGPEAAPELREMLADPLRSPRARAVCADALREIADDEAGDVAAEVIREEADPDVLAACLRLLRRVGGPEHLPSVRALSQSPDQAVRAQAIAALGRLGGPSDTARLRGALDDESAWVALHAARALRSRGQSYALRNAAVLETAHAGLILQVLAE